MSRNNQPITLVSPQAQQSRLHPIRFAGEFEHLIDVRSTNRWLIARAKTNSIGDPFLISYFYPGAGKEANALFQEALQSQSVPAVHEFLKRNGAFEGSHWRKWNEPSVKQLPEEVRATVRSLKLRRDELFYIADLTEVQKELQLYSTILEMYAVIRDEAFSKIAPLTASAEQLLGSLTHRSIAYSTKRSVDVMADTFLDVSQYPIDKVKKVNGAVCGGTAKGQKSALLSGVARIAVLAFNRALGQHAGKEQVKVAPFRLGDDPALTLSTHSMRSFLYLVLLNEINGRWRRCARPDCIDFFHASNPRMVYCTNACAHLENMRAKRRKEAEARAKKRNVCPAGCGPG